MVVTYDQSYLLEVAKIEGSLLIQSKIWKKCPFNFKVLMEQIPTDLNGSFFYSGLSEKALQLQVNNTAYDNAKLTALS